MQNAAPPPVQTPLHQPATPVGASTDPRWHQSSYVVKERRFTLGRQYRIFDANGQLVAYCKQKMFKLKEDIRFYADESQKVELFRLAATKVLDWAGNFEVVDSATGHRLGVLRRKAWRSLVRDEWHVFDPWQQPWGVLKEDTGPMAILRRVLGVLGLEGLIPYEYRLHRDGADETRPTALIRERFQLLWGDTYDLSIGPEANVDARVLLGLTICIDAIEGE